jgi:putative membrane protein insertion efficiency factor
MTPRHPSWPARALLGFIWLYRHSFSAIMGRQCRFEPSCSAYMAEAVRSFGAGKGVMLGGARLLRCHPWGRGGFDPVPEAYPPLKNPFWGQLFARNFFSKNSCGCDRNLGNNTGAQPEQTS